MADKSILGRYRLHKVMYPGQNSQVWQAVEMSSGRHFAIKMLLPESARRQEDRQLLFHEAAVGKQLNHKKVIKIVKLVKAHATPHIVMEYFPSENLGIRIKKRHELVQFQAHSIIQQAATGYIHLHSKGYVHRDIKPDNILVNSAGEVKIIDFALAKKISRGGLLSGLFAKKGKTQGTRSYMSPEQVRNKPLDERSDIYSFGATLYQMVTSRPPFVGRSPAELLSKQLVEKPVPPDSLNSQVNNDFAKLVLRMLAKNPKDRPGDFSEFLAQFHSIKVYKGDRLDK